MLDWDNNKRGYRTTVVEFVAKVLLHEGEVGLWDEPPRSVVLGSPLYVAMQP